MPNTYKQIFHVIAQRSHGRFTVSYTTFYPIISRIKVNTRNKAPIHFVARASLASIVLALFFAKKESATPPIAPERPALLPDWKRTTRIMHRPHSTCKMVKKSFITENLHTFTHMRTYTSYFRPLFYHSRFYISRKILKNRVSF